MPKIRNKITGEIIEIPDQGGGMQRVGPANTMRPLQEQGAALGNQRTQQQITADQQMLPLQVQKTRSELQRAPVELETARIQQQAALAELERKRRELAGNVPLTPDKRSELSDRHSTLGQFERELGILEKSFDQNFRNQGALGTLRELLPGFMSPTNQNYNATSQRLLPLVAKALGFTAQQMNTPAELTRLESYVPKNTDSDLTAQNKMSGLREMLERQRSNVSSQLGRPTQARRPRPRAAPAKSNDGWKIEEVR